MKFVFDNIIFSKEKQGGISNYWYELIKSYSNAAEALFIEEDKADQNIFRKKIYLTNIILHRNLPLPLARMLPVRYLNNTDDSLVLYHSSFYRRLIASAKVCEITTIHDFIHNKYSKPLNRILHNKLKYASIERSNGIICISNNTFLDLKRYCKPRKNQKIAVIYNGVSDDYKPIDKGDNVKSQLFYHLTLNDQYLLFVGARSSYKNFDFVVQLLSKLPKYKLVVVGNAFTEAEKKTISTQVMSRIILATGITNDELNVLYNYAHALIYPSSYEGFGIPIVEAMKAGCPVFALNTSSIPEVAGNAAMLYNDLNIADFLKGIEQLKNMEKRERLVNTGIENSRKFSWLKCVKETTEFYNEVYSNYLPR